MRGSYLHNWYDDFLIDGDGDDDENDMIESLFDACRVQYEYIPR